MFRGHVGGSGAKRASAGMRRKSGVTRASGMTGPDAGHLGTVRTMPDVGHLGAARMAPDANGSPISRGRRRRKGCFPTRRGHGRCGACWPTRASARCWRRRGLRDRLGCGRPSRRICGAFAAWRCIPTRSWSVPVPSRFMACSCSCSVVIWRTVWKTPAIRGLRASTSRTTWRCGRSLSMGKGRSWRRSSVPASTCCTARRRTSFPPVSRCQCRAGARCWNGPRVGLPRPRTVQRLGRFAVGA